MAIEPDRGSGGGLRARASKVKTQTREVVLELLKSELEVADTFVSTAETTTDPERAVRNVTNAWMALKTALELAEQLALDSAERLAFRDRYGCLCLRLADLQIRSQD